MSTNKKNTLQIWFCVFIIIYMTREIKFRGKNIDNGRWEYGFYAEDNGRTYILTPGWQEVIPETIGQFTGLYDKNGAAIYEGDVVAIGDKKAIIQWDSKFAKFVNVQIEIKKKSQINSDYMSIDRTKPPIDEKEFEIIGNLFENPELLNND